MKKQLCFEVTAPAFKLPGHDGTWLKGQFGAIDLDNAFEVKRQLLRDDIPAQIRIVFAVPQLPRFENKSGRPRRTFEYDPTDQRARHQAALDYLYEEPAKFYRLKLKEASDAIEEAKRAEAEAALLESIRGNEAEAAELLELRARLEPFIDVLNRSDPNPEKGSGKAKWLRNPEIFKEFKRLVHDCIRAINADEPDVEAIRFQLDAIAESIDPTEEELKAVAVPVVPAADGKLEYGGVGLGSAIG